VSEIKFQSKTGLKNLNINGFSKTEALIDLAKLTVKFGWAKFSIQSKLLFWNRTSIYCHQVPLQPKHRLPKYENLLYLFADIQLLVEYLCHIIWCFMEWIVFLQEMPPLQGSSSDSVKQLCKCFVTSFMTFNFKNHSTGTV